MIFQIVFVSAFVLFVADAEEYMKAGVEPVCKTRNTCFLRIQTPGIQIETPTLELKFSRSFGSEPCDFYMSKPSDETIYITICGKNGKREVEGAVYSQGTITVISPTTKRNEYDLVLLFPDYASRSLHDEGDGGFTCLAPERNSSVTHVARDRSVSSSHKKRSKRPVIELFIVVDEFLVKNLMAGNRDAAEKFAFQSVHGATAYLRELGIRIKIVGFQFMDKYRSDRMYTHVTTHLMEWCYKTNTKEDCEKTPPLIPYYAQRFLGYKRKRPFVASDADGLPDVTLLMSGITDTISTWRLGGIAWPGIGDPCNRESVPCVFPHNWEYHDPVESPDVKMKNRLHRTARITAHELGHIVGLEHIDDKSGCSDCPVGNSVCMMHPAGPTTGLTTWSRCSTTKVERLLRQPADSGLSCLFTWDVVAKERSVMQSTSSRCDLSVLLMILAVVIITSVVPV